MRVSVVDEGNDFAMSNVTLKMDSNSDRLTSNVVHRRNEAQN